MDPKIKANPFWFNSPIAAQLLDASANVLREWFAHHLAPPDTLYHYTSASGLTSILKSNRLWASHAAFLNDASEIVYAQRLIGEVIEEQLTRTTDDVVATFLQRARYIANSAGGLNEFYVACFCEEGDLLSQWRAYGRSGGGYAIGFSSHEIGMRWHPAPEFLFRRVIYSEHVQRDLVARTLDATTAVLLRHTAGSSVSDANNTIAIAVSFLKDHLAEYLFTFKSATFAEEKEWRVVLNLWSSERNDRLSAMEFRTVGGLAVPYFALDLSPASGVHTNMLPIASVRFGPTLHTELADRSLEMLLQKHGYSFAEVLGSNVPLRY